jgi:hypothetical protein
VTRGKSGTNGKPGAPEMMENMTEPMRAPNAFDPVPQVSRVLTRVEFADGTGYEFEATKPHGLDIKVHTPLTVGNFGPVDPVVIPPGPVTSVRIEFKASGDRDHPMMMRRLPHPLASLVIRLYECPLGHAEQRPEPQCGASAVHCACGEVMTEVSD